MKKLKLFLLTILILLLASCDMPSPKNPNDYLNTSGVSTWEELFKGYWRSEEHTSELQSRI